MCRVREQRNGGQGLPGGAAASDANRHKVTF